MVLCGFSSLPHLNLVPWPEEAAHSFMDSHPARSCPAAAETLVPPTCFGSGPQDPLPDFYPLLVSCLPRAPTQKPAQSTHCPIQTGNLGLSVFH